MSPGQGSIATNVRGGREVYRGSKAALNQYMRGCAARETARALVLVAPGWICTDLGGPARRSPSRRRCPRSSTC